MKFRWRNCGSLSSSFPSRCSGWLRQDLKKIKRKNRTLMTTNEWIIVACGGPLSQQKSEFDIETFKPHARITRQLIRHITSQLRSLTDNLFLLVPPDPCNAFFENDVFFVGMQCSVARSLMYTARYTQVKKDADNINCGINAEFLHSTCATWLTNSTLESSILWVVVVKQLGMNLCSKKCFSEIGL